MGGEVGQKSLRRVTAENNHSVEQLVKSVLLRGWVRGESPVAAC